MKKIFSVILILTFFSSVILTGCGLKSGDITDTQSKANISASASSAEKTETSGDPAPATFSQFPFTKDKVTISAFISKSTMVSDLEDNHFTKYLEELTNVHINMIITQPESARDKRNLLLSSGDYPDMFLSGGFSNGDLMKYGAQEKILIPLNQYIDEYGVEVTRLFGILKYFKDDITAPDGNIYALSGIDEGKHASISNKMYINTDWLKKLDLKMPTTTEELKNVLVAFKTEDPNGNGKNDEIPLTGAIGTWAADPQWYLMASFLHCDQQNNFLSFDKQNNLVFAVTQPEFREGLKYVSELYKEGLIDPGAFTQNLSQLGQLGNKPEVVIGAFTAGHIAMGISINDSEMMQKYQVAPILKGPSGFSEVPYRTPGRVGGGNFAITDKCKTPDIAYRIGDVLYNEEVGNRKNYGIQGYEWDLADPGTLGITGKPAKYKFLTSANQNNDPKNVYWRWDTTISDITNECRGLWAVSQDIYSPDGYLVRLYQDIDKLMSFVNLNRKELTPLYVDVELSNKLSQDWTNINSYITSEVVEFITGKKDIDKEWDSYLKGFEKLKLQEYLDLYKKAIDQTMAGKN